MASHAIVTTSVGELSIVERPEKLQVELQIWKLRPEIADNLAALPWVRRPRLKHQTINLGQPASVVTALVPLFHVLNVHDEVVDWHRPLPEGFDPYAIVQEAIFYNTDRLIQSVRHKIARASIRLREDKLPNSQYQLGIQSLAQELYEAYVFARLGAAFVRR